MLSKIAYFALITGLAQAFQAQAMVPALSLVNAYGIKTGCILAKTTYFASIISSYNIPGKQLNKAIFAPNIPSNSIFSTVHIKVQKPIITQNRYYSWNWFGFHKQDEATLSSIREILKRSHYLFHEKEDHLFSCLEKLDASCFKKSLWFLDSGTDLATELLRRSGFKAGNWHIGIKQSEVEHQKKLMELLISKHVDMKSLFMEATESYNIGALQVILQKINKDNLPLQDAIEYLQERLNNLKQEKYFMFNFARGESWYNYPMDIILRAMLDVLEPGLGAKNPYTGPKSKKSNWNNNNSSDKNHEHSQTQSQSKKTYQTVSFSDTLSQLETLEEFYNKIKSGGSYTPESVLKVKHNATTQQIKEHYKKLLMHYHPDRQPAENKHRATEVTKVINVAYLQLMKTHK